MSEWRGSRGRADGGRVLRRGGRFGRRILSVEETADGATRSSASPIDAKIGSSGIRFKEPNVSVCADCPARFFDESRSSAEHRSRPWQQTMAADHGSSMRIELPNGVVIHVSGDLDGQRLVDEIIAAGQICSVHADMTTRDLPRHEVLSC